MKNGQIQGRESVKDICKYILESYDRIFPWGWEAQNEGQIYG